MRIAYADPAPAALRAALGLHEDDGVSDPMTPPQGFAADGNPPYGDDSGPTARSYPTDLVDCDRCDGMREEEYVPRDAYEDDEDEHGHPF